MKTHIIYCRFYNKKKQGLQYPVYPGKIGKKIYENISQKAWNLWITKQTKIINEKKLNMFLKKDQELLQKKMMEFLFKRENSRI